MNVLGKKIANSVTYIYKMIWRKSKSFGTLAQYDGAFMACPFLSSHFC